MTILAVLGWLKGFSLRQYAEAAAVAALIVGILWWDHREIQKGRDECEATHTAAEKAAKAQTVKLQSRLDEQAAAHDKALQDAINAPHIVPSIRFDPACKLTAAEVMELNKAWR